jgi:polyhydroxyalkanoate synthesis regulator phasin
MVFEPAVNDFDGAAYNMAALTATVALYRALVRKGAMSREEARQILLDEAIAHAIQTEALMQEPGVSKTTLDINRQCEEILKFIAEHL